jgi:hypothetical protein
MFKYIILVWAVFMTAPTYADHSSDRQGYDPNRTGYIEESCDTLKGIWLGHINGCLKEETNHYILIGEYEFLIFTTEFGDELKKMNEENPDIIQKMDVWEFFDDEIERIKENDKDERIAV